MRFQRITYSSPNLFATPCATTNGCLWALAMQLGLVEVRRGVARCAYPWPLVAPSEQLPEFEVAGEVPILRLSGHLLTPSVSPLLPQLRARMRGQHWGGYWGQSHLATR